MIISEVCKEWFEDKEILWFGKSCLDGEKLKVLVDRLINDERFIFLKYGLGYNIYIYA